MWPKDCKIESPLLLWLHIEGFHTIEIRQNIESSTHPVSKNKTWIMEWCHKDQAILLLLLKSKWENTKYTLIWGKILVVLVCEGKFSEDPGCLVTRTQQQYISFWWTSNLYYIDILIAILSGWNIDKNIGWDVQWIFEDCWICCKQDGLGVINGHQ